MCKIFTGGYLADYAPLDRLGEIYGNSGLIKISLDCRHITGLCGGLICYIIFNVDDFALHLSLLYDQFVYSTSAIKPEASRAIYIFL